MFCFQFFSTHTDLFVATIRCCHKVVCFIGILPLGGGSDLISNFTPLYNPLSRTNDEWGHRRFPLLFFSHCTRPEARGNLDSAPSYLFGWGRALFVFRRPSAPFESHYVLPIEGSGPFPYMKCKMTFFLDHWYLLIQLKWPPKRGCILFGRAMRSPWGGGGAGLYSAPDSTLGSYKGFFMLYIFTRLHNRSQIYPFLNLFTTLE